MARRSLLRLTTLLAGAAAACALAGARPAAGGGAANAPGRGGAAYRYIWTARSDGPFTAHDLTLLGNGFDDVIIEKSYDHGDFAAADAAARRLAAMPGHPRVFVNYLTTIITAPFLRAYGAAFDDAWILRDTSGRPIPFHRPGFGWYVDLSNPAYRSFIERQVAARLRRAPYAGVMFDNFHTVADDNFPAGVEVAPAKAAAVDAGLVKLIAETRRLAGPHRLVYVNGVARGPANGAIRPDRGFGVTADANGVQDEFFCYLDKQDAFRPAAQLWADIGTYRRLALAGKTVLHSVKLRTNEAQARAAQVKRFCFGAYLMDEVPGRSLIQFKLYADEDQGPQIEDDGSPEQSLDLGPPLAPPTARGTLWTRRFEHGWVAADAGDSPATVAAPGSAVVGGGPPALAGRAVVAGARLTIPPHDAVYLVGAVRQPSRTPR